MLTEAQIAELKEKNPGVALLIFEPEEVVPGVSFVFKRPKRDVYKAYRADVDNEQTKAVALERLSLRQAIQPPAAELAAVYDEYPGLADAFGVQLLRSIGAIGEIAGRKA